MGIIINIFFQTLGIIIKSQRPVIPPRYPLGISFNEQERGSNTLNIFCFNRIAFSLGFPVMDTF
jgi:hypothetical protein